MLWFIVPLVSSGPRWLRWTPALGRFYPASEGIIDLAWYWQGRVINVDSIWFMALAVIVCAALVVVLAVAVREARVSACLMMLAIVAASMPGTVIDWSLWSAVFRPWDYPSDFGSLAPAGCSGEGR